MNEKSIQAPRVSTLGQMLQPVTKIPADLIKRARAKCARDLKLVNYTHAAKNKTLSAKIRAARQAAFGHATGEKAFWRGDAEAKLLSLAKRSSCLYPGKRGEDLKAWFTAAAESAKDPESMAKVRDLLEAVRDGDQKAKKELAGIVTVSTQNWMQATSDWMPFFRLHTLQHDDKAYMETTVPQEVGVTTIGRDGRPEDIQPHNRSERARVRMTEIATDGYLYPLSDLEEGFNCKDRALMNVDLTRDLNYQRDAIAQSYLLVGAPNTRIRATFTTTGPETSRDYFTHTRVNTANFPAGNFLTLSTNTATSGLRQDLLVGAAEYVESWGDDVFPDGNLTIGIIRVPSAHVTGWLQQVQISNIGTGGHSNSKVEEVFDNGFVLSFGKHTFRIVGDNTLDPADGIAYIQLGKPVGHWFEKPSLNRVVTDTDMELRLANQEIIYQTNVFGVGFFNHETPNYLAIRYRS